MCENVLCYQNVFSWETRVCPDWQGFCVAEQVHAVHSEEKEKAATLRVALEDQMDQLRDVHQKQVGELRDEISEKQALINQLKEWVDLTPCQNNQPLV